MRFRARSYFLTYPKCDILLETFLEKVKEKFIHLSGRVEEYIVAKEFHEDGSEHRHAYIKLDKALNKTVDARCLDINDHHPHIDFVKSERKCKKYCIKDGDYLTNIKWEDDKVTKRDLGKIILSGKPLVELVPEHPQLIFGFAKLEQDIRSFRHARRDCRDLEGTCGAWIYGPAGVGKSWWANARYPNAYSKGAGKWWCGYDGEEVVIYDDWDSSIKDPSMLKYAADFKRFPVEQKGLPGIRIRPKLFIVTSNLSIEEYLESIHWPKNDWAPYIRRFREFYCGSREDVEKLKEEVTFKQP